MSTSNFKHCNASKYYTVGLVQQLDEFDYTNAIEIIKEALEKKIKNFNCYRKDVFVDRDVVEVGGKIFDYYDKDYKQWYDLAVIVTYDIGYYDGINFDWQVRDYGGEIHDYTNAGYSKKTLNNIEQTIKKIEEVLQEYTTPMQVTARFSNGETWYSKVN